MTQTYSFTRNDADRFDERDTIFSRMFELTEGTQRCREYYQQHPSLEAPDKQLREYGPGFYSGAADQAVLSGGFSFLADLRAFTGKPGKESAAEQADGPLNDLIAGIAGEYDAVRTGITRTNPRYLYSYRGRGSCYGEEITDFLPYSIIFAVPMDRKKTTQAPKPASSREVVKRYLHAAVISLVTAYTLRELGFEAVCHIDGESRMVMPPMAEEAGLGYIGLMGLLLTRERGPRVRLSAVTTNAPLRETGRMKEGHVPAFCSSCGACAKACPAGAIAVEKEGRAPRTDSLRCFGKWKELGTDCGICLSVCPYKGSSLSSC